MSKVAKKKSVSRKSAKSATSAPAAGTTATETAKITPQPPAILAHINPDALLLGDNIRYKIQRARLDRLKEEILESNGINSPIEVRELTADERTANPGKTHQVITGTYRTTAATELNKESQAGLLVPALIRQLDGAIARIKRQLQENMERENMSLMDISIAIGQMKEAGMSPMDIRKAFPRVTGKNKIELEAASASWVSKVSKFTEFPKTIQDRISDGRIPLAAAYELWNKGEKIADPEARKDAWKKIMEDIETQRLKDLAAADKEEEKFLAAAKKDESKEQKELELQQKAQAAATKVEEVTKTLEETEAALKAATKVAAEAYHAQAVGVRATKEEKAILDKTFAEADAALDMAKKDLAAKQKEAKKAEDAKAAIEENTKRRKEQIEAAAKAAADKAKAGVTTAPVTAQEVRQAASRTQPDAAPVKLTFTEAKEAIKSLRYLSSPTARFQKTIMVGTLIEKCFAGEITDAALQQGIAKLLGETKS